MWVLPERAAARVVPLTHWRAPGKSSRSRTHSPARPTRSNRNQVRQVRQGTTRQPI